MPEEVAARPLFDAFHLPVGDGHRFCMLHSPARSTPGPSIVYAHPFGEEMNKSRRMAALQARALAGAGWTVLQIDLQGSGDSEGDFADASWERWTADVAAAATWLGERSGSRPWLWGLRAGCLLALAALRRVEDVAGLLFWQPVLSGRQHLQQFLRLKLAAELLPRDGEDASGVRRDSRASTEGLREALIAGTPLEIAGYTLAPAVAAGLDAARLSLDEVAATVPVVWIELSAGATHELAPASRAEVERRRNAQRPIDARAVGGPSFWQTQEIEECPELVRQTLAAVGPFAA